MKVTARQKRKLSTISHGKKTKRGLRGILGNCQTHSLCEGQNIPWENNDKRHPRCLLQLSIQKALMLCFKHRDEKPRPGDSVCVLGGGGGGRGRPAGGSWKAAAQAEATSVLENNVGLVEWRLHSVSQALSSWTRKCFSHGDTAADLWISITDT